MAPFSPLRSKHVYTLTAILYLSDIIYFVRYHFFPPYSVFLFVLEEAFMLLFFRVYFQLNTNFFILILTYFFSSFQATEANLLTCHAKIEHLGLYSGSQTWIKISYYDYYIQILGLRYDSGSFLRHNFNFHRQNY